MKENQIGILEDIKLLFAEADAVQFKGIDAGQTETLEKIGGRVESCRYELLSAAELPAIEGRAGCCCVGRVRRKRTKGE